jgi:2-enoate reductase
MDKLPEPVLEELTRHFGNWFDDGEARAQARMTSRLHPYTHLFAPIGVNSVTLKNRIVMGPMGNLQMAEQLGRPSQKLISYFAERARGGVGLITSGLVPSSPYVDPSLVEAGDRAYLPRIDRSRTMFSGWRDVATAVHAHGAKFFIQLTPGAGRVGSPECLLTKHQLPVSSSWNPNFYMPGLPCRPLTDGECRRIIREAGQAAADARAMQIDGVYLHGHEGYLLEQMTNPAFNRRKLGQFADWQAFGLQLVREIRRRVGAAYPIMYRLDLSLALSATYRGRMNTVPSLKLFRRERTIPMTLDYIVNLVRAGVDLLDVDLGGYDNWWLPHPPNAMPPGCFLPAAKIVKDHLAQQHVLSNAGLPVPVVAVGKLGYPDLAEQALRDGKCDLVMLARPLLADAHWAAKAYAGRTAEIIPCIGDQEGCLNEIIEGGHIQCAVNPRTGFEDVLEASPAPARQVKKVAIIGGGPAGIVAACTAAQRGHAVTLFEQRDRLGGMLVPGSMPKIKFDVANYLDYLTLAASRAAGARGLDVRLNTTATAEALLTARFEAVVVCTGGRPAVPPAEGLDQPHVVQAVDLLRRPALAEAARQVLIVGGGSVGIETAHFLAYECGKEVTVVEMLPVFMKGVCTATRGYLLHYLEAAGVRLLNCTRLKRIEAASVTLIQNVSPTVPDPWVTWAPLLPDNIPNPLARPLKVVEKELTLPADLVVLAAGLKPDDTLYQACVRAQVAPELHNIGDAFSPGRVLEAVRAGYAVGCAL